MSEVKAIDPVETQEQVWDRGFLEYGTFISKKFNDGTLTLQMLSRCTAILSGMSECYRVMLKQGMVDRLENQEPALKKELWDLANENKGDMDKSDMILFCKAVLCIEILLQ